MLQPLFNQRFLRLDDVCIVSRRDFYNLRGINVLCAFANHVLGFQADKLGHVLINQGVATLQILDVDFRINIFEESA